ncbi:hypothetical protein WJX72_006857 [[Myrmecia] bisecta]|uniref:Flavin-containing monooxygenase n=1 Tax=[Myrmecia] bisecta TaxID=41462 RepID=A0AAW1PT29_9CHLO
MKVKVAVVGTGVAGLQTLREILREGHSAKAFEISDDIGGVWRQNYVGASLQGDKASWALPEFPWPQGSDLTAYPPRAEVQAYLRAYASHFDLLKHISFNTAVTGLRRSEATGKWTVTCKKAGLGSASEEFDWVAVCTGSACYPRLPAWAKQPQGYQGTIIHSRQCTDTSIAAGKHVLVIGGGKSALDAAENASKVARQTTLLARTAHWAIPRFLLHVVPQNIPFFSRLGAALWEPYYTASRLHTLIFAILRPMIMLLWMGLASLVRLQLGTSGHARPKRTFAKDMLGFDGMSTDGTFYKLCRSGKIAYEVGEVASLNHDGITTKDGQTIKADLIICATGFNRDDAKLLGEKERAALDLREDGSWLYREMLPANLPGIAFIGASTVLSMALFTAVQAKWLAAVMSGRLQLPSPAEMEHDVAALRKWKRRVYTASPQRATHIHLHLQAYLDQVMGDLGVNPKRKSNALLEWLDPILPADYRQLFIS